MRGKKGFTLIELMVTVVLSFVIIGAIYTLYGQSVSAYRVEGQSMDMQDRLRFGLEHIKRDLRRAGFLATPNSALDSAVCPKPTDALRAITLSTFQDDGSVYREDENVYVRPTSMVLFGDFFSGKTYRTAGIQGNQVILQATQTFPDNQVSFNQVFNPSPLTPTRYLRIMNQDQFEVYLAITDADFASRTVTLESSVPAAGAGTMCGITGFGEGLEVNVAGFVRYRIVSDERPDVEDGKTDLVRDELQLDGKTPVPNSQLVIADYAVDLQYYDFGFDMDDVGNSPNFVQYALIDQVADDTGGGFLGKGAGTAIPHRLRYLTVKLTVRTVTEDPEFNFQPRENGKHEPLVSFDLSDMKGSCRTSSLASRVELTSLAVRNLVGGP